MKETDEQIKERLIREKEIQQEIDFQNTIDNALDFGYLKWWSEYEPKSIFRAIIHFIFMNPLVMILYLTMLIIFSFLYLKN